MYVELSQRDTMALKIVIYQLQIGKNCFRLSLTLGKHSSSVFLGWKELFISQVLEVSFDKQTGFVHVF